MIAMDRILCPVDFSDVSRHALQHAAAVARWYKAKLTLLHVFTTASIPPVMVTSPELLNAALPTAAGLKQLAEQLKSWVLPLGGGFESDTLVQQGTPASGIVSLAASLPADLIVIGTHGYGGFQRLLLGSVTEKVLRTAPCPVLTVPPPAISPGTLPFKRVLCATDFSIASLTAVRYAMSVAKESDARLMIVHVFEWPAEEDLRERDAELERFHRVRENSARERLDALISKEDRAWCQPVTILEHGRPWQTILGVAEREHADLIVMGVHGRNVVDRTLFGSTTNQVVRRAPCPVMTLGQQEVSTSAELPTVTMDARESLAAAVDPLTSHERP